MPVAAAAPDGPPRDLTSDLDVTSTDVGRWEVTPDDEGGWRVAWTAPDDLPVTDARPQVVLSEQVGELPAGSVLGDGVVEDRTVSLHLPGGTPPAPDALDVRLGTQVLDEPIQDAATGPDADGPARARAALAKDPGVIGSHQVVTSDYTRPGIKLPGLADPVEVVGHVEAPADASSASPLVVLLHGRHRTCADSTGRTDLVWPCPRGWKPIPSHLGFHYLQERLASQGFVTVSVSANGVNAQDGALPDGGALARARLLRAHLDLWSDWVASGARQADLSDVVLLGHSRGGEGAALAALETPLSARYRIRGLVLLAPTNLGRRATPYLPTVTVLSSCDGDVVDLQGQTYTDATAGLAAGDTSLHSSVMLVGANHDWFNSEWKADDWTGTSGPCAPGSPRRLTAGRQRQATRAYVAGAVRMLARPSVAFLPMYDGSRVSVPSAGTAVVLSHAVGAGRALRWPRTDAVPTMPTGGAQTQVCRGVAPAAPSDQACGHTAGASWSQPHWPSAPVLEPTRPAFEMSWSATGATGGLLLRRPWDVSAATALDLRTVVDPARGPVQLGVRLTDTAGRSSVVSTGTLSPLPSGGDTPGRLWAQTLRVPLKGVAVDLRTLSRITLVARSAQGRVWVLDAASTDGGLPAVPARRAPLVDLGSVTVREGDGPSVARLPYRVRGTVPAAGATVQVSGLRDLDGRVVSRPLVTIPAGTTSGTVSWPVDGNRRDSLARSLTRVTAYGVSEVVAGDANGAVTVLDDDPPPQVRVRVVRDRVSEGGTLVWVLSWRPASDYAPFVRRRLLAVRHGRGADADDLPRGFPAVSELPLATPGVRRWVVRVPIRRDGRAEPSEVVRLRVAIPQFGFSRVLRAHVRASR